MMTRDALEKANTALTQARDYAVILTYAVKGAPTNVEQLNDLVASADTLLEQLTELIVDAQGPIHQALVEDGIAARRAPATTGGTR